MCKGRYITWSNTCKGGLLGSILILSESLRSDQIVVAYHCASAGEHDTTIRGNVKDVLLR